MTFSEIHEIDPDGDTLLILRNPGAPFAVPVCHTEERWHNELPQYQSSESKHHEESVTRTEASGDSDSGLSVSSLPRAKPEPTHVRFRLCSQHLRLASTFFRRMMCGNWKETESEPDFKWTTTARDWDHDAFLILMNILHHQTRAVPRALDLETLAKVAVLVDYYDCCQAVEPWAETWISNLDSKTPTYYSRELLLRLTVAWVFAEYGASRLLTEVIIRRSRGPIHTLGLPIPQAIVDLLEEKRQDAVSNLVLRLHGISDNLNVGKDECSRHDCLCMQLGCIHRNLFVHGLQPLPRLPYLGFSLSALREVILSFQYPKWVCPSGLDHIRALERNVSRCLMDTLEDFKDGIDIRQFRNGKREAYNIDNQ